MKQELRKEMKAKDITLGCINIGIIYKVLRMDEITWK